jgi:hypothetical protein
MSHMQAPVQRFTRDKTLLTIVCCWIAVLCVRFVPIAGTWDEVAPSTYLFLLVSMALFVFAWKVGTVFVDTRAPRLEWQDDSLIILLCAGLALAGSLALGYEFAINRGYGFTMQVTEIRILEVDAVRTGRDVSLLGGIGRMLMPALFLGWILYRRGMVESKFAGPLLFLATFFTIYVQAVFEGGRFFLVSLFIVALFSASPHRVKRFSARQIVTFVVGLSVFAFASLVFIDRATGQGRVLGESFLSLATGFPISLSQSQPWGQEIGVESAYFILSMFWVYITSAINDLDILLRTDVAQHAWGAYQFPQFWGVVALLTGYQNPFSVFMLARTGVYVTAYGGWYVDFGHAGAMIAIPLQGLLTGYATALFKRGHLSRFALLSPLFVVTSLFLPIHSIITTLWPAMVYVLVFGSNTKSLVQRARNAVFGQAPAPYPRQLPYR